LEAADAAWRAPRMQRRYSWRREKKSPHGGNIPIKSHGRFMERLREEAATLANDRQVESKRGMGCYERDAASMTGFEPRCEVDKRNRETAHKPNRRPRYTCRRDQCQFGTDDKKPT